MAGSSSNTPVEPEASSMAPSLAQLSLAPLPEPGGLRAGSACGAAVGGQAVFSGIGVAHSYLANDSTAPFRSWDTSSLPYTMPIYSNDWRQGLTLAAPRSRDPGSVYSLRKVRWPLGLAPPLAAPLAQRYLICY